MLDPEIPEQRREQIASEARGRIESGGSLKHDTSWGMRKLAYEIRQRTEADYRFFRFETDGNLLDELNHNLRIADGVLRFRIFHVDPGSPAIVPPAPLATPAGGTGRGPRRAQAGSGRGGPARSGDSEPPPAADAQQTTSEEAPETPEPAAQEAPAPPEAQGEETAPPAEQDSEPETGR